MRELWVEGVMSRSKKKCCCPSVVYTMLVQSLSDFVQLKVR